MRETTSDRGEGGLRPVEELGVPQGWYALGLSRELGRGQVRAVTLAGRELVLFRTQAGAVGLLDAFCPHLGAHLGHGGTVTARGAVRCPFHGFEFDSQGACVATGYGSEPPPTAVVPCHRVMDRNGVVLAWVDPLGRPPGWEVPVLDIEAASGWATHHWVLPGHPQETSENSVDLGHFDHVHGYSRVTIREKPFVDGPVLRGQYSFFKRLLPWGAGVTMDIDVSVYGLGVSVVSASARALGLRFWLLVLPTPLARGTIDLRIALAVRDLDGSHQWHRLVPRAVTRLLRPLLIRVYRREISQDFEIWRHKRYAPRPALAAGDGPVGLYRQWVRQFYPQSRVEHRATAATVAAP